MYTYVHMDQWYVPYLWLCDIYPSVYFSNRETVDEILETSQRIVFVTNLNLGIINLRDNIITFCQVSSCIKNKPRTQDKLQMGLKSIICGHIQGNSRKWFGRCRLSCLSHYICYLSIPLHTNSWDNISRTLFVNSSKDQSVFSKYVNMWTEGWWISLHFIWRSL